MIKYPKRENTPISHLPFSPVTQFGDLLFVSGQASVDSKGNIVKDTFEGEVRRSFDNLKQVLEDAGSSLKHVLQTRNYVRDPENVARYNQIYQDYFSSPFPARTTITRCLGDDLQFEVECIAISVQGDSVKGGEKAPLKD